MPKSVTKNLSTKVLSARVTPEVYEAWQNLASTQNKSVSECLRDAVTMVDKRAILKAQDGIQVPDDIEQTIAGFGSGAVGGILIYKGVYAVLSKYAKSLSNQDIEIISGFLAVAGGILIGTKVYKNLK